MPGHDTATLAPIADETGPSTAGQTSTNIDSITDETDPSTAGQTARRLDFVSDETDASTAGDETGPSPAGQTTTSLAPIPDETGPATAAQLVNKKLRISGFERVMKGTPPLVKSELLCSPPNSGRSERLVGNQMSARSQTSARSARSETSQRIINDLQAQIAKLKEELAQDSQTPRSARSEKSQRIIDDLHAQIAKLTAEGENSLALRSARSELISARSQVSARSTRSDTSQRIIYDLSVQIIKLKEELAQASKTPRSARSETSQRIIDDLNAQIARLTERENCQTPMSARSDTSQRIITDLQAQIAAMKAEKDLQSATFAGPDATQHANAALLVQIATPRDTAPASDEHPAAAEVLPPEVTVSTEPEMLHCFKPEALSSAPYVRILAYGDGLTAGYSALDSYGAKEFASYGQQLVDSLAPKVAVELWVCGLSAATAAQLADEAESGPIIDVAGKPGVGMKAALTMHGPFDLVLIMLGTNDLASTEQQTHRPALVMASKIFENIERIHTVCHERNTPTVVLSVPESRHYRLGLESDMDAHYVDCWRHLNASLQKWSVENREMVKLFIDTGKAMPWSRGSECWECDGIHFSIAGCRHLGNIIAEALLPVIRNIRKPAGEIDFWQLPMEVWTPLPDPERLSKHREY